MERQGKPTDPVSSRWLSDRFPAWLWAVIWSILGIISAAAIVGLVILVFCLVMGGCNFSTLWPNLVQIGAVATVQPAATPTPDLSAAQTATDTPPPPTAAPSTTPDLSAVQTATDTPPPPTAAPSATLPPTNTPTPPPPTQTPTNTPPPPTPMPTGTPIPPTATSTSTQIPPAPTATNTAISPTSTATPVLPTPSPLGTRGTVTPISTPPLPTPTATRSSTGSPTPSPTPTSTPVSIRIVAPPSAPGLPNGVLTLLDPLSLDVPSYGPTDFKWSWVGDPIPPQFGFEVSVWLPGEIQAGVHDAVLDAQQGGIDRIGGDRYRLKVGNIRFAAGVKGRTGTYFWTAAIVRVSPHYETFGLQAPPVRFRYEAHDKF